MRCDACRNELNRLAFTDSLEETWTAIRDTVEAPSPGFLERLLGRFGVSAETGRLLAAVPSMRGGWLAGVTFSILFAGFASMFGADVGISLFLMVAPLAPVAGVAAAFGGDADPSHELVVTTPYSAGRLLLLRTLAVLATCTPIAMLVGLALPGPAWLMVAWLSPAAAGIAVTLALAPAIGLTYCGHLGRSGLGDAQHHHEQGPRPARPRRPGRSARLSVPRRGVCRGDPLQVPVPRTAQEAVMNSVVLTGVGKKYGRSPALSDVGLSLAPGITGLLGPNGAGKTTLLRILATALAADEGEVRVLGQDPTTSAGRTTIRRNLGYLPQEAGFPRGFTTFGFVDYMAILKEWTERDIRHAEVRRVLDQVDLGDLATKRVHALSGGQRRRVLLAQALLGQPDVPGPGRTDDRPRSGATCPAPRHPVHRG